MDTTETLRKLVENGGNPELELKAHLEEDILSEQMNDCEKDSCEINAEIQPINGKQVTIETENFGHLYNVIDNPPVVTTAISALQHSLLSISNSFSITFILAELVCAGKDDSLKTELMCSTLFVSGIATLLQSTIGIRLPLYQGPAVEYIIPLLALSNSPEWNCQAALNEYQKESMQELSGNSTEIPEMPRQIIYEKIQSLQGSLMLISLLQILTGATGIVGLLSRYIGPITIIPMMLLVGLYIFRVVVKFSESHYGIAMATTSLAVILSLYLRSYKIRLPSWSRKKGFHIIQSSLHNTFSLLIAIIFGWVLCAVLTETNLLSDDPNTKEFNARTDSKSYVISSANWFFFPYPGCFGFSMTLSISSIISFFVAMISSIIDSIADYHACSKISYVPVPPKHAVNRGVLIEGIASLLAGAIGIGHGTNSYGGNIGAIEITRVASRRVFQVVSLIYIMFGILGKLSAFFVTIPFPVLGGIQVIYFGSFAGIALSNIQRIAMSYRNLTIIGVSILLGMTMPIWIHQNENIKITGDARIDNSLLAILRNPNFLGGFMAFMLDNFWPGSLKDRGFTTQEDEDDEEQMQSSKNIILKNKSQISEKDIYGIPFYPRWLSKSKIGKLLPFLPNYE